MSDVILPKIYCKAEQWYVYYSVSVPGSAHKRRYKVFGDINRIQDKKERMKAAKDLQAAYKDLLLSGWRPGQVSAVKRITDCINKACDTIAEPLRPRSVEGLRLVQRHFLRYLEDRNLSGSNVDQFDREQALAWCSYLKKDKGLRNITVNKYVQFTRWIFNHIKSRGWIAENPFAGIKSLPEEKNIQNIPFTREEAAKLSAYLQAHEPGLWRFVQFIYYAGIRPLEICQLRVQDIDLQRGILIVGGRTAKTRTGRTAYLSEHLIEQVRSWELHRVPGTWYVFSKGYEPGEKALIRNRVSEHFTAIKKRLDVPTEKNLYSWKHYAAGEAYDAGVSLWDIKEQFGHSSLDQTAEYLASLGRGVSRSFSAKIPKL